MVMRVRATSFAASMVVTLALVGCSGGEPEADASSEPVATASSPVTATAAASPSATATPSSPAAAPSASAPEPSAPPESSDGGDPGDDNDPGDGVAVDPPRTPPSPEPGESVAEASVLLTGWGPDGASFTASAIVESVVVDGVCTMTMSRGGEDTSVSGPSARSASSSSCAEGLAIPLDELSAGQWSLTIAFEADGFEGASAPREVVIP